VVINKIDLFDLEQPIGKPAAVRPSRSASRYALQGLIFHLYEQKDWPRLFALLETKPFLVEQVRSLGGYQAPGEDLETYALAAAIENCDWQRFLHYAVLALNLRGLAEDLAEPTILHALAGGNDESFKLALDSAGRLADPFRQAQALASIASGCEDDKTRQDVLRQLENRLDDLAREANGSVDHTEALVVIAREVGPDLKDRWAEWIDRLAPKQATQVWRAVSEAWLRRDDPLAPELWRSLANLGDPSQILAFVPVGLGAKDLREPAEVLLRLEALLPDLQDRQWAGATLLGKLACRHPERACTAWEEWSNRSPPVWSMELIDLEREVLGRLAPQRIEEIAASIEDPSARAALRVVVLEARRTSDAAAAALTELRGVPDGPEKLHWSLRYLAGCPEEPKDEIRRQVIAVGHYLHAIGFTAEIRDVTRWLDLVARHLPDQISNQLDCVLWSQAFTPEKVLSLADAATQEVILELLLERAERCAAALSATEAEGFVLRKDLMIRAACRLCEMSRSLKGLDLVVAGLLLEEEDELRARLALRLSAPPKEDLQLAEEVCAGIGDRRLRLVTLLRSVPSIRPETLAPASLYAALARIEVFQDECHGLMALLETPADPRELLQRLVLPIRDPLIRTRALLRLARHTLAFEIACHNHPDRLLPLELVRWMITTETDDELASLTPAIAELGAGAGGKRATAEIQEAVRQLAALETVDWPVRREALEGLLARVAAGLLSERETAKALAFVLRLPLQLRPETARQKLRQQWQEILPLIAATADRLPDKHLRPVRRALREGQRDFSRDAVLSKIFGLCLAPAAEREKLADSISTADLSGIQVALAYLLTAHSSHRVPEIIRGLPAPERARLALRLIRYGWLPEDRVRQLLPYVAGDTSEAEAEIWCGPEKSHEAAWTERAALWIAGEAPSPSDPHIEPLFARLWSAPEVWRPALAWAVQDSLRGGRPHGEAVLRIWLHAHLAPSPGRGRLPDLEVATAAEKAFSLALRLGPERISP